MRGFPVEPAKCPAMNRPELPADDIERDPVWSLLARSPAPRAGGRFVDDVMRAARLGNAAPLPWWHRWVSPLALGGLSAAAAGVVLALWMWMPQAAGPDAGGSTAVAVDAEAFSDLQAMAEEEMLAAAADHLSEFSDAELVVLLGF